MTARSNARTALCPLCGAAADRVQSHYVRQPSDLPCVGRRVRLRLLARRFRCGVPGYLRQVFAERFGITVLAERARRTGRIEEVVHYLGLAMGGRPGAGFAQRLMLPVSNDTLLCCQATASWTRQKLQPMLISLPPLASCRARQWLGYVGFAAAVRSLSCW